MTFSIRLIFLVSQVLLVASQDPSGFISLSCGSPRGTIFREKETNIKYTSDEDFIHTGVGNSIKSSHRSKSEQPTWHLRSFPQGIRNCYTLNLTRGDKYLIRTTFLHGGYDDNPSTQFDLHLGPNRWATVSTANETKSETFEMIHQLTTDRLQVCLVKTNYSTPFISALELRKLKSNAYQTKTQGESLMTFFRADIGSVSNKSLRYRANEYGTYIYGTDVYDRIWMPYNSENWSRLITKNSVGTDNKSQPPEEAMVTASVPTDPYAHMNISLTELDRTSRAYVAMHFSEIQDLNFNDTREINIMYNGRLIWDFLTPPSFYTLTFFQGEELGPNVNGEYIFSVQRTADSTLPPLLNAMEVYLVNSLSQQETDRKEVDAMMNIKSGYGVKRIDWEGDPCAPQDYRWDGINCSYRHNEPPKIISLNLTASGLAGEILESISNLTNLQVLDLSNNSLNGSVPEFLANMETLKLINLSSNQLTGSIPTSLLDKAQKGSVSLRIEGNPGLCSSASCDNTNKKKTIIIVCVAASIVLIFLIAAATLVILKRMRRAELESHPTLDEDDSNLQQRDPSSSSPDMVDNMFTYECLAQATGNFSSTNLIGQGGFGYVYRGVLPDGTQVAIKQLKSGSQQGEREFQAEIEIVSRVHHRHLVSLFGHCIEGSQRLLVYELVPNKTLEFHLHEKGRPVLNWTKRMQIALGAARGLAYLHDDCSPKTIHRDVKAANILVDDSYEAKVADFGLAKCWLDTDTHVSTRVMGTFGYLAPEYASSGKLTDKSDVFSFGVILLELITGRRPIADDESLTDWAKPRMIQALKDGNFDGLVDPRLEHDYDIIEMRRMVACAATSVRHSAKRRPKMSQIVRAFESNLSLDDLTEGENLEESSDYSSRQYRQNLKIFSEMVQGQTFGSSECSTSYNVHNPSGSSSSIIQDPNREENQRDKNLKTEDSC